MIKSLRNKGFYKIKNKIFLIQLEIKILLLMRIKMYNKIKNNPLKTLQDKNKKKMFNIKNI